MAGWVHSVDRSRGPPLPAPQETRDDTQAAAEPCGVAWV